MTSMILYFQAHQPWRLKRHFEIKTEGDWVERFFNTGLDKWVFDRAAWKCYSPTNRILLESIDRYKSENKKFKVCFSLSGVFLEQAERYSPDTFETFKQLAETGCVEFLDETYYHSLCSLWEDPSEFIEQIKKHRDYIKWTFGFEPKIFRNTELLYNNKIAKIVEGLGYKGILCEGTEKVLGGRSPNYIYKAKDTNLPVILRDYRLSDDIGYRFSDKNWDGYPLTAQKYAAWLAATQGDVIPLFLDYETFGEHHWPETGIFEFLKWFPGEALKYDHLEFSTLTEAVEKYQPVSEVDVFEIGGTVSWADMERDETAWLGNDMQKTSMELLKTLEKPLKEMGDSELLRIWRLLQISDHFYWMSTKGWGFGHIPDGDVHAYFSPYDSPWEACENYLNVLNTLAEEVLKRTG